MKFFMITLFMTLSSMLIAATSDSRSVFVNGSNTQDSFSLFTETTRTQYRTETVTRTCYRNEIIGYQRVCNLYGDIQSPRGPREPRYPDPRPVPPREPRYPDPRPVPPRDPRYPDPRPLPPQRPVCHDEPIIRTVPYTCYDTISVPYEVLDHQTISNINVSVQSQMETNYSEQCSLNFLVSGDNFSSSTNCNNYLAISNDLQNKSYDRNGAVIFDHNINVKLLDLNQTTLALKGGLTNMHMEGQTLVVNTGDLVNAKNYTLHLFVERRRFLKGDDTLIDRNLSLNEIQYTNTGSMSGVTRIDLDKLLGGINTSKKHKIKLQLDVVMPVGNILNRNLPNTHQESEITVWDN